MKELKKGVTTGLCAAAAAKAAANMLLLAGPPLEHVEVRAKDGSLIKLSVTDIRQEDTYVKCAVQKYSGDDPDITNAVKVFAHVSKTNKPGITVDGGEGIGRVTKPGLQVAPGKAAINPVPMEMIESAVKEVIGHMSYTGGIKIIISIPGGEEIAKKTMNERLGIIGGLSILGTTGIVEPMSDRALIETIKAEIDVLAALGKSDFLISPGNYGRDFAKTLNLDISEAIKCSNFIGEALNYACTKGNITLIGHAGKLVKLAGGIMNTHSAIADCRMEIIAAHCALMGATKEVINQIMSSVSTEAAEDILKEHGISKDVWESIGQRIAYYLRHRLRGKSYGIIEYIVFTQEHGILVRGRI